MGSTRQTVVPFFRKYFLIKHPFDTAIKRTESVIFVIPTLLLYFFKSFFVFRMKIKLNFVALTKFPTQYEKAFTVFATIVCSTSVLLFIRGQQH